MGYAVLRFGKYSCPATGFTEGQFSINPKNIDEIKTINRAVEIIRDILSIGSRIYPRYEVIEKGQQSKLIDFLREKYPKYSELVIIPEYSSGKEFDFILGYRIDNVNEGNRKQLAKMLMQSGIAPKDENNFRLQMKHWLLSSTEREGLTPLDQQESLKNVYIDIYSKNLLCFQE